MWRMSWKATILLSVIIPISLLATFRLTGILPEPPTPETITVDTVSWNMTRPSDFVPIEEEVTNLYADGLFSGNVTIHLADFYENSGFFEYNDVLMFILTANVNVSEGFICSVSVRSLMVDEFSILKFKELVSGWIQLSHLELRRVADGSHLSPALLQTTAINNPKTCTLKMKPYWIFLDADNLTHSTTITLEVIYFDGTVYRQANIPIQLEVLLD
jgi:hypothetical protein